VAQLAVAAIDFISGYPTTGHPGLEGPFQHLPAQHWLGRKGNTFRDACRPAAGPILHPTLRKIQFPIQQHKTPFAGITEKHAYLTVLDTARGSTVLPLNPG